MPWIIDPFHTLVEFSVVHLTINIVKGRFKEVRGSIYLDNMRPENSWVQAQVNAASIDSGIIARDNQLRSANFFDVATYHTITFASTVVQQTGPKSGMVTGNLTLRGVTYPVSFQTEFNGSVRDPETGGQRLGFFATTIIDRRTFNMLQPPQEFIGHEVRIELHIEAVEM
jgi:polyisoprenoid-binding protein YceI